ncbi:MAG: hypothetical protein QXL78_00340 [Methanocellales archaeon]
MLEKHFSIARTKIFIGKAEDEALDKGLALCAIFNKLSNIAKSLGVDALIEKSAKTIPMKLHLK